MCATKCLNEAEYLTQVTKASGYPGSGLKLAPSTVSMAVTLFLAGCPSPYTSWIIVGLLVYLAAFAPGVGPVPWAVNAELYPQQARPLRLIRHPRLSDLSAVIDSTLQGCACLHAQPWLAPVPHQVSAT